MDTSRPDKGLNLSRHPEWLLSLLVTVGTDIRSSPCAQSCGFAHAAGSAWDSRNQRLENYHEEIPDEPDPSAIVDLKVKMLRQYRGHMAPDYAEKPFLVFCCQLRPIYRTHLSQTALNRAIIAYSVLQISLTRYAIATWQL